MKESIERIRQADSGYPELKIIEAYKAAPLITVGEQCTSPQDCRKCLELCAPKVFVLAPDAKLMPTPEHPVVKVGWEATKVEAMRVIAAEPTVCTLCMTCVRACPIHCITIKAK